MGKIDHEGDPFSGFRGKDIPEKYGHIKFHSALLTGQQWDGGVVSCSYLSFCGMIVNPKWRMRVIDVYR
jgi:hypothetical protein